MLDTSILLTATDEDRSGHEQALDVITGWPAQGAALYTSGQIRFGQHVQVLGLMA